MDVNLLLEIVGMIGTMAVQTWLIVKFLIVRQDNALGELRKENAMLIKDIYERINTVSNNSVPRDEFNNHVAQANENARNLLVMLTNLGVTLNTRLDSILLMMARGHKDDNKG